MNAASEGLGRVESGELAGTMPVSSSPDRRGQRQKRQTAGQKASPPAPADAPVETQEQTTHRNDDGHTLDVLAGG